MNISSGNVINLWRNEFRKGSQILPGVGYKAGPLFFAWCPYWCPCIRFSPLLKPVIHPCRRYSQRAAQLLLTRPMKAKTFDFHTEALMIVYRNGLSILEVRISYNFSNSSFNHKVLMNGIRMVLDIAFAARK